MVLRFELGKDRAHVKDSTVTGLVIGVNRNVGEACQYCLSWINDGKHVTSWFYSEELEAAAGE